MHHGLAPSSAPHLSMPAVPFTSTTDQIEQAIANLQSFVTLGHPLAALGMAYSQLAAAADTGSLAIFAAMTDIDGLQIEDRRPGRVFFNPRVIPEYNAGTVVDVEPCFSCLMGCMVAEVRRWKVVTLESNNLPPLRLEGPAAIVAQHEYSHLLGRLCVDTAFQTSRPVFYVPPELRKEFFANFHRTGRRKEYPHRLTLEQWTAIRSGEFQLERYL